MKQRPVSTENSINMSESKDCLYLECLIFIGEEFKVLTVSNTDMFHVLV